MTGGNGNGSSNGGSSSGQASRSGGGGPEDGTWLIDRDRHVLGHSDESEDDLKKEFADHHEIHVTLNPCYDLVSTMVSAGERGLARASSLYSYFSFKGPAPFHGSVKSITFLSDLNAVDRKELMAQVDRLKTVMRAAQSSIVL